MPVRPLLARPGARFACAGDGLCCSDAHVLGPLTRGEVRALPNDATRFDAQIRARALRVIDGRCLYRETGGCRIHVARGGPQPRSCQRYPYRLVATPVGGRVVTDHRCPCRTLGDRPPIDLAEAERVLRDGAGRLQVDARVTLDFDAWLPIETPLLARLAAFEDPLAVLDAEAFPSLDGLTWIDVAHHYRSRIDGSACGDALAWFGDVLLETQGTNLRSLRARPWRAAFDRAEARTPIVQPEEEILADWLSDAIWGLEWTERGSWTVARAELATRVTIAREIARRIEGRRDRAMAEAVMIVELAGATALFRGVMERVRS